MNGRTLTASMLTEYDRWLRREERSDATREKYLRSVRAFAGWLGGAEVTKEAVTEWESAAGRAATGSVDRQHRAGRAERPVPLPWLGGLPRKISEGSAPHLPRCGARADAGGV